MIDSHTHLDLLPIDEKTAVAEASKVGVHRILTIGIDPDSCQAAALSSECFDGVFFAVGHHPNNASSYSGEIEERLREQAQHPKCLAIGETGLDYYRDLATKKEQILAFESQIAIARDLDKPLIIHTRHADEDTINMLENEAQGLRVILHCFSMIEHVERCIKKGWWFSFAGNVTYPSAKGIAEAAKSVPLNRILVETDAPYLSPQTVRRERNQPAFVVHTARSIADLREISYEDFERAVKDNAVELLGW